MCFSFQLQLHVSKLSKCFSLTTEITQLQHTQRYVPTVELDWFNLKNNSSLLTEGASIFWNATYVMAVLE
jgi:hypothetical protein